MISAIVFLPLVGALLVLLVRGREASFYRWLAVPFSGIPLLLSALLWSQFNTHAPGFQFEERAAWLAVPQIGAAYHVALDGLSLPLVILTTFIGFLSVVGSFGVTKRPQFYFFLLLLMQTSMTGVFCVLDLLLFFVFWEGVLIPMYLLIAEWGSANRDYASWKFLLYTGAGSALMFAGILAAYFLARDPQTGAALHTFDFVALKKAAFPEGVAAWLFVAFFLGFAFKVPMAPFHTWLPDAHTEAPTIGSVILAGVLLKMGGYGLLRFNLGLFPDVAYSAFKPLAVLGAINIVYGGFLSLAQKDMKRLIAYSSVSHMGFVLLGMAASVFGARGASAALAGYTGAVYQMVSHGLITGMLFFLIGAFYERTHTRQIGELSGIRNRLPVMAGLFLFACLASLGLPGLSGFVAEFLVLVGSYSSIAPAAAVGHGDAALWVTVLSTFTMLLTAGYLLWLCQRVLFGPFKAPHPEDFFPLRPFEAFCAVVFCVSIFFAGMFPGVLTETIRQVFLS